MKLLTLTLWDTILLGTHLEIRIWQKHVNRIVRGLSARYMELLYTWNYYIIKVHIVIGFSCSYSTFGECALLMAFINKPVMTQVCASACTLCPLGF